MVKSREDLQVPKNALPKEESGSAEGGLVAGGGPREERKPAPGAADPGGRLTSIPIASNTPKLIRSAIES
jgi:hypothetical protein